MNTIKLTREKIHALSGSPGKCGFTNAQIKLLGVPMPPKKGWLSALIGKEISTDAYEEVRGACRKKWKQPATQAKTSDPILAYVDRLKEWIRSEGERSNTCTFDILGKEICSGCRCHRASGAIRLGTTGDSGPETNGFSPLSDNSPYS